MDDNHIRDRSQVTPASILIDAELPPADQQALSRAAGRAGIADQLMQADPNLRGYPWYDSLTRVSDITITISADGRNHNLQRRRDAKEPFAAPRPDRLTIELHTLNTSTKPPRISLPADVVFFNEDEDHMDHNLPLVTKSSTIAPADLSDLLYDAFFDPSDDPEANSHDTQSQDHRDANYAIAVGLLHSPEESLRSAIEDAVHRHVAYRLPHSFNAEISIARHPLHHTRTVSVLLSPAPDRHDTTKDTAD